MLIFITVLMLNVWAIPADDLFLPNINILEELGKIKLMETRMESLEKEMERLRTENTGNVTLLTNVFLRTENFNGLSKSNWFPRHRLINPTIEIFSSAIECGLIKSISLSMYALKG